MESENLSGINQSSGSSIPAHTKEIGQWATFIGVSGFVLSVLLVLIAIFGGSILNNLEQASFNPSRNARVFTVTMFVAAGIFFLISITLLSFGKAIRKPIRHPDFFSKALQRLKIFFRTVGIILIFVMVCGLWVLFAGLIAS